MDQVTAGFNPRTFLRSIGVRQVRLAAGLVLFSYLLSHFINHSLGNISLAAMEYGLWFHMALWRSLPGTLLLYPALAVHGSLGLWALYERRHFKWKATELPAARARTVGAAEKLWADPV